MAILVEVPYGERCPNKDIKKTSYENCKNCEHKVSLAKTFSMCHLKEKEQSNTIDNKPKYRIGDTFRRIGVLGYTWWKVEEIVYGVTEPVYVLKKMPFGKDDMEIGESELCENWFNTTISNS